MIELLIALVVVIGACGLIWSAICLLALPRPFGLIAHIVLSIAMVVVLLGYVLPMVHMPHATPETVTAPVVVTGTPTPRTP
jgi:hypothetical protein